MIIFICTHRCTTNGVLYDAFLLDENERDTAVIAREIVEPNAKCNL